MSATLYTLAVLWDVLAFGIGFYLIWRHGHYFRTHRSLVSEARYLTVAASITFNFLDALALVMYLNAGLNQTAHLELVFGFAHFLGAGCTVLWHLLSFYDMRHPDA